MYPYQIYLWYKFEDETIICYSTFVFSAPWWPSQESDWTVDREIFAALKVGKSVRFWIRAD
jgi:hypothetical protein